MSKLLHQKKAAGLHIVFIFACQGVSMDTAGWFLAIALGAVVVVQVIYHLLIFSRNIRPMPLTGNYRGGVSVIICARNNRKGLAKNLEFVLQQNYPEFEVIVVNDGSTDGSKALLEEWEKNHDTLRHVWLDIDEKYHRGKKFALTMGIKAARYPVLLLTDSDCRPASQNWISHMVAPFSKAEIQIVLGLAPYERLRSLLNWVIQLDTFHTAFLYTNLARFGKPYMGIGRNLAYRRDLFFSVKGFARHQHILSGDDDLFVNETAIGHNTVVCTHRESLTISDAHRKSGSWLRQKLRHLTTAVHYKRPDQTRLILYHSSLILGYVLFGIMLVLNLQIPVALILFGTYLLASLPILAGNLLKLHYGKYLPGLLLFHPLWILLVLFLGIRRLFWRSKPKAWI